MKHFKILIGLSISLLATLTAPPTFGAASCVLADLNGSWQLTFPIDINRSLVCRSIVVSGGAISASGTCISYSQDGSITTTADITGGAVSVTSGCSLSAFTLDTNYWSFDLIKGWMTDNSQVISGAWRIQTGLAIGSVSGTGIKH